MEMRSEPESIAELVPAGLSFLDESERAALLGVMMRPPPAAGGEAPGEGIGSASAPAPLGTGDILVSVLVELGVLVALLALCGLH